MLKRDKTVYRAL